MLIKILDSNEAPVLINPQFVSHFVRAQFGTIHMASGEVITIKSNEIDQFLENLENYFSGHDVKNSGS
ncbi:MAG: hypothetical protein ABJN26_00145 [Stappiaceae bacterium]